MDKPGQTELEFPVVGIGAAAGSSDAFKKILAAIPPDSGMAYVLLQHLSSGYDNSLTETLSQVAGIPVEEIINEISLQPNHVYIIPENNNLIVENGVLKLQRRITSAKKNETIDIFFRSLAEVHKSYAIGIILSGTAFDGTAGLKKIKDEGGVTIAQNLESAAFKGMPQNAIEANTIDFILKPEEIPVKLVQIHQSYKANFGYSDDIELSKAEEEILNKIVNLVFLRSGNDFSNYRQPTIRRRIAHRMVVLKKQTLLDYYNALRIDKTEQDSLFDDFLIPVTYFFRNHDFFDTLPTEVFPQLVQNAINKSLRIWVVGCSTGEEAYSIAISLHEFLTETNNKDIKVQIFASDISRKSITKARAAAYSPQDVQNVSESRLRNYFTKRDGYFHINKVIRDMCIFAVHNFIKDPPFAKIDMISCRNVLIYLNPYLQHKVLGLFRYSLREKGFLLLGKSENAASVHHLFEPVSQHEKIYSRKWTESSEAKETIKTLNTNGQQKPGQQETDTNDDYDICKIAADILYNKYTPAGVIVTNEYNIVDHHGDTSPFLQETEHRPHANLLKIAMENLSVELHAALMEFRENRSLIRKDNIALKDKPYLASFEIVPIDNDDKHIIVLFYQKTVRTADDKAKKSPDKLRIWELEDEMTELRENIYTIAEDQQTAFEELQANNKNLLITNEASQELNEELDISNGDVQSTNEELICVNEELLDRQEQLIALRDYSESIIRTMREPRIIVDQDFMILNANPAFYNYFGTTESETEGHSFFEIGKCQWNIPEFKQQLSQVLNNAAAINDFRVHTLCPGLGKKIMMVHARPIIGSKPAGQILITFEDITELVEMNELLVQKNDQLKLHNEQLETFTASASRDLQEPLSKINMFCSKIKGEEKNLSENSKQTLDRIMVSVANMGRLIEDLIDFSKATVVTEKAGKKTDLNPFLKKVVAELRNTAGRKIEVTLLPLPVLPVNTTQMQQLFNHLLLNSIKYAKEDTTPQLTIGAEKPSPEEISEIGGKPEINYTKIKVTDNGIGFKPEYAERIFEPFTRLHSKDEYTGSGLGLALVKKIVANHHGIIKAESDIGMGTVMSIYLPMD